MKRTLLLTSWYMPHKVIRWQDAVTMLFLDKADRVIDYQETICSPSVQMHAPAVIRLRRKIAKHKRGVRFSRVNVFTRDSFRCQYCRTRLPMSQLTYDHVTPRACGGRTEWTNIVTACRPCNSRKRDRTPDESGMFPHQAPVRPKALPMTGPVIDIARAPREWHEFLVLTA
jgi:5-methylcytosine-specific restriction endonuclease McrA